MNEYKSGIPTSKIQQQPNGHNWFADILSFEFFQLFVQSFSALFDH